MRWTDYKSFFKGLARPWLPLCLCYLLAGCATVGAADVYTPHHLQGSYWVKPLKKGLKTQHLGMTAQRTYPDVNYTVFVNDRMPKVQVCAPASWSERVSGCKPTKLYVPLPTDFTIPNVTKIDRPNNPLTVYNPQTGQIWNFNAAVRPYPGGMLYAYAYDVSHGGSFTSGGQLTTDDLNQGVSHALAVCLWGKRWLSAENGGFIYPARKADGAYKWSYQGTNPNVKMGSLLMIPPTVTAQQLGLTSDVGRKLLKGMQQYGAYIIDDSGWDSYSFEITPAARPQMDAAKPDLLKLLTAMHVVLPNQLGYCPDTATTRPKPQAAKAQTTYARSR
jgi:hypothetical protein